MWEFLRWKKFHHYSPQIALYFLKKAQPGALHHNNLWPVPNSKCVSVLDQYKCKSFFKNQYWFSTMSFVLVISYLNYTWQVIPKCKLTVKIWSVKISNFEKFYNVPRFSHFRVLTFPRCYEMMTGGTKHKIAPGESVVLKSGPIECFLGVLGRF